MDSSNTAVPRETSPDGDEDLPSCESCRRRKLKCTRQRPSCAHCQRLEISCVYEQRRNKPGLKSGAVESLNRRLENVEKVLFNRQQNGDHSTSYPSSTPNAPSLAQGSNLSVSDSIVHALTTLSREISNLNSNINSVGPYCSSGAKKRKCDAPESWDDIDSSSPSFPQITHANLEDSTECLLAEQDLDELLDVYFTHVQPWIPMIHEAAFRRRLESLEGRQTLSVVLQAMRVAALRFMSRGDETYSSTHVATKAKAIRRRVISSSMDTLSVESLQALIIIAYTDIGNGESSKAWSIIGSLTRTVEYLQLSIETEACQKRVAFMQPLPSLAPPTDWVVDEERRRVFWNVFILDRFCSVSTGWNTSLTAADVCRRLPVCGGYWHNVEPSETPYFGIWDPSSAKMGNSITFLPAHYPSPSQPSDYRNTDPQASRPSTDQHTQPQVSHQIDMSKVGAFAYYIESIESLSRVTSHFLHQRVNFKDRTEVSNWLMRFKELDLRLIHWKLYLPRQWKDSGLSRETMPGVMDPNMTVANATHNVSMILLHQRIAYPDAELSEIQLPHQYSAETCQSAATENATITNQFLAGWPINRPVSPQLGFCAFVSARVLLVHSRYYNSHLPSEFWSLVESLEEMSRRWVSKMVESQAQPDTLFRQFAIRLRNLFNRCAKDPNCNVMVAGSPEDPMPDNGSLGRFKPASQPINGTSIAVPYSVPAGAAQPIVIVGETEASESLQGASMHSNNDGNHLGLDGRLNGEDELTTMSQVLMDQRFMDMDRIISFDDMLFVDEMDGTSSKGMAQWNYPGNEASTGSLPMSDSLEKTPL